MWISQSHGFQLRWLHFTCRIARYKGKWNHTFRGAWNLLGETGVVVASIAGLTKFFMDQLKFLLWECVYNERAIISCILFCFTRTESRPQTSDRKIEFVSEISVSYCTYVNSGLKFYLHIWVSVSLIGRYITRPIAHQFGLYTPKCSFLDIILTISAKKKVTSSL